MGDDDGASDILFYGASLVLGGVVLAVISGACSGKAANTDWGDLSGLLQEARVGKGMFGVGGATREQARVLGRAWVGPGHRVARDGKTLVSADGLRVYRPPSMKPKLGKVQANLERWVEGQAGGRPIGNAHIDILD